MSIHLALKRFINIKEKEEESHGLMLQLICKLFEKWKCVQLYCQMLCNKKNLRCLKFMLLYTWHERDLRNIVIS